MKQLQNDAEFQSTINEGVVLVDFFATWCNPCKMLAMQLEQIKDYNIVKADIEELPIAVATYNIMSVPTLALFKDGQLVGKAHGFMPKEAVENWIESNL